MCKKSMIGWLHSLQKQTTKYSTRVYWKLRLEKRLEMTEKWIVWLSVELLPRQDSNDDS